MALLMDMLDKAHARATSGECSFSSLPAIQGYPKHQPWKSPRFKYFYPLNQGMEKVGPRGGRGPRSRGKFFHSPGFQDSGFTTPFGPLCSWALKE